MQTQINIFTIVIIISLSVSFLEFQRLDEAQQIVIHDLNLIECMLTPNEVVDGKPDWVKNYFNCHGKVKMKIPYEVQ